MKLIPLEQEMLPALYDLYRRIEIFDQIPIVTPWEEIAEMADDPHLDLPNDGRLALIDDQVVGFCHVIRRPGESDHARAFLVGGVDPDYRRQGIGSALLSWEMDRGAQILRRESPHVPRFLRTFAFDFEQAAIALYERHGLTPIRSFAELIRPLHEPVPTRPVPGIDIVSWEDGRYEEARLLLNLAFRDHWGSTPRDGAAWDHFIRGTGTRLDLSCMALAGDRLVGVTVNAHFPSDQEITGRRDGWIGHLGTHPEFRKRGIASALIERSCAQFSEAGFDHALIGVDSASLTGAYRLYESLGFRPLHRQVQHQIEV
ncbi:MAG TPA: GNAT family N-acetyltransferase [Acidimicrobiia bacterium]